MPNDDTQSAFTLTIRQWDRTAESDPEWYEKELLRIADMIADGYTSGEVVGENDESGWWDFSEGDGAGALTAVPALAAALQALEALPVNKSWSPQEVAARDMARAALKAAGLPTNAGC